MKNNTFQFSFPTAENFVAGYIRQNENNYLHDNHYFRGGFQDLAICEEKVAELVGTEKNLVALTTSGMSAIATAIDLAGLNSQDIIVHGATLYGQTYDYITVQLKEKGILPIEVDTNSIVAIDKKLKKFAKKFDPSAIKLILVETIGNDPDMPILDVGKFLALPILQRINPLIIIDNTLPTNTIIPLANLIQNSSLKIIGLESATKFYLFNQDLGGILFTNKPEIIQLLKSRRKRIGATPGPSLIRKFKQLLPTKKEFDKSNKKIIENTIALAKFCSQAKGCGEKFDVTHASAPMFFIISLQKNISAEKLFYQLEKLGALKQILFTESFGFAKTSISYASRKGGYIRVAGGKESKEKIKQLGEQLEKGLSNI